MDAHSPGKRTITNVRRTMAVGLGGAEELAWLLEISHDDDGFLYAYQIFHKAFSYRVAEYGLDPYDFDTLMHAVLCEPHAHLQADDPAHVYHVDEKTARDAYLKRIGDLKVTHPHHDPHGLLDQIRQSFDPGHPEIAEMKKRVHQMRTATMRARGN